MAEIHVHQGEEKWPHVLAPAEMRPGGLRSRDRWLVPDQCTIRTDGMPRISGMKQNRRRGLVQGPLLAKEGGTYGQEKWESKTARVVT